MIFNILRVGLIIFEVLLIFNLLIIVHELGHFLAARWRGLHVDKFGVWFGRPILKRTIGGVEFSLGWIPAGGFVLLPQMATMEAVEGKAGVSGSDLPPIKPLDKIIVAAAGPLWKFGRLRSGQLVDEIICPGIRHNNAGDGDRYEWDCAPQANRVMPVKVTSLTAKTATEEYDRTDVLPGPPAGHP